MLSGWVIWSIWLLSFLKWLSFSKHYNAIQLLLHVCAHSSRFFYKLFPTPCISDPQIFLLLITLTNRSRHSPLPVSSHIFLPLVFQQSGWWGTYTDLYPLRGFSSLLFFRSLLSGTIMQQPSTFSLPTHIEQTYLWTKLSFLLYLLVIKAPFPPSPHSHRYELLESHKYSSDEWHGILDYCFCIYFHLLALPMLSVLSELIVLSYNILLLCLLVTWYSRLYGSSDRQL